MTGVLIPTETQVIAPILLVDDDTIELDILKDILANQEYQVLTAENGNEAIEIFKNTEISLVVSDYHMPGISGIELLENLYKINPDIPRILLTGNEDPKIILSAINQGKTSFFLHKPWTTDTLLHTIRAGITESTLRKRSRQMEKQLLEQLAYLSQTHALLKRELMTGKHIHEQLLVGKAPQETQYHNVQALSIASKDLDGDFFHFYLPSEEVMDLIIGDVMGKGIPGALIGVAIKEKINHLALPLSRAKRLNENKVWIEDLFTTEEIIQYLHNELTDKLIAMNYFAALLYGRVNYEKRILTYTNCGLPPPLHYKKNSNESVFLKETHPPIGVLEEHDFQSFDAHFEKGDIFLFYSDGITEASDAEHKDIYGSERLKKVFEENIHKETKEILNIICNDVQEFTNFSALSDDLTLVIVKIKEHYLPNKNHLFCSFIASLEQMSLARDFIHRICCKAPGDSQGLSEQMQIIVSEIFSNLVKHGSLVENQDEIRLEAKLTDNGLLLEITDQGKSFDPELVNDPNFHGGQDSGFGCFIVKQIASSLNYRIKHREDGWNSFTIFKEYI